MYTAQALLYFIGLFIISIAFGKMYNFQEIGFIIFGAGTMLFAIVIAMLKYLPK